MSNLNDFKDERGRFAPGNPGSGVAGPGRPKEEARERIRAALQEVLDEETLRLWAQSMRRKLAKGNISASEFVLDRVIGRPAVVVQHTGEGDALALFIAQWQAAITQGDDAPAALPAGEDEQARA